MRRAASHGNRVLVRDTRTRSGPVVWFFSGRVAQAGEPGKEVPEGRTALT